MPRERRSTGHPILYYLRNFRFHSVLLRYYVLVFFFFYLPFVGAVIGVTTHYSNQVRDQIETTYSDRVAQVGGAISSSLRAAEINLFQLSRSESLGDFVESTGIDRPGYDTLRLFETLTRELSQQHSLRTTYYVVSMGNGFWVNSLSERGQLRDSSSPIETDEIPRSEGEWIHVDHGPGVLRVMRPVIRPRAGATNGIVLALVDTSAVLRSAQAASLGVQKGIYLLTPAGEIIDSDAQEVPEGLIDDLSPEELLATTGRDFRVISRDREEYALFSLELHRGYVCAVAVPTERFLSTVRSTNRVIFLVAALLGVLMVPLVFAIAVHLYNPVKQLFELAEQTERATRSESKVGQHYDEVRFITDNIVRSLDRQRELESELERRVTMLNRAQILALQSQISPHFLNNTLSTISWLAMNLTGGENDATRVVNDLSSLLRSTLESDRILTTIREELEHARTYVDIQRVRYRGLLNVEWDIPDDVLDEQIVRVTLQPLLENAIYHGVKPKKRGTIVVRAARTDTSVTLDVIDDGTGMPADKIDAMNRSFEAEYAVPDDHIGLANVNQRLRLVFGAEFGLSVRAGVSGGTKVKITLPGSSQPHVELAKRETHPTHS